MEQQPKTHIKSCPICESTGFKTYLQTKDYFLTQEDFKIVQCKQCEFIFTNPIPSIDDLSKYYDSPDYLSHTVNKSVTGFIYDSLRNLNIKKKYRLISSLSDGNKILDIGQGTGEFLNYFKQKGWETLGVEPNKSARKFAIDNYQLKVFDENELDKLEENSFDVITLWHVLEHVPDLNSRIIQIKKLIKTNGSVVIALPNIESPDATKYGEYWAGLDVPRHLYHFSEDSIKNLLDKYDMNLVSSHPMKFDAYYVSLLSEKYMKAKLPYVPAFINGFRSNLSAREKNNYSSMIFVAKQK